MDLVRPLLAMALVFGLLGLAIWTLRRRGVAIPANFARARKGPARLQVIERLPLAPAHALYLVRFGDRALLVSVHAGGCTLLDSLALEALERAPRSELP